jgi:hypothetical protein
MVYNHKVAVELPFLFIKGVCLMLDLAKFWVYDIETYKECFSIALIRADGKHSRVYSCSKFSNESESIFKFLNFLEINKDNAVYAVGFNNVGFDYPILHDLIELYKKGSLPKTGSAIALKVWKLAQKQIDTAKGDFPRTFKNHNAYFNNLDLYRIWHFNNKAKATSLKMLEFNMRLQNIEDLPFSVEASLSNQDVSKILDYNKHDVKATLDFFLASQSEINLRFSLGEKYGKDFVNDDDTKIGEKFFRMKLEDAGVKLYTHKDGKKVMKQSPRSKINLGECLFSYYDFKHKEFQAVFDWFSKQSISETKGVFTDIDESKLGDLVQYAYLETKRKKINKDSVEFEQLKKEHPLLWIEEVDLKATEYAFDSDGKHIMEYPLDENGSPDFTKKQRKKRVPKKSYYACWREAGTLNVVVDGFRFDFGTGGIHGSLSQKVVKETKSYLIRDADV